MRRPLADLEATLEAMPDSHVRAFLGLSQERSSCVDLSCGCDQRAENAEDLDPASDITLRIHDSKRYERRVELSGNWIASLEDSGEDEYGPFYLLRVRPSRFRGGSSTDSARAVELNELTDAGADREHRRGSFDDGRGGR